MMLPVSWPTFRLLYIILAVTVLIPMTKTHLEHQKIRYRQNRYGNATTPSYDPYVKYDPQDGITTALILGVTFLLTIVYITFKYGWHKFKIRFCYAIRQRRDHNKNEGEEEQLPPNQTLPKLNLQEKCIPIVLQDGSELSALGGGPAELITVTPVHPPANQVDTYTMIVSEAIPKQRKSKSRSSGTSPEKQALLRGDSQKQQHQQQLPPAANQVLRTAHWVNTVANELVTSADENEKSNARKIADSQRKSTENLRRQSTIEVEINHIEETIPLTSNISRTPCSDDKTKVQQQRSSSGSGSNKVLLDLATSEV